MQYLHRKCLRAPQNRKKNLINKSNGQPSPYKTHFFRKGKNVSTTILSGHTYPFLISIFFRHTILLGHTTCFNIYIIGTHYLFEYLYYWDTLPVSISILMGHTTCLIIYNIGTHYLFEYLYY